MRLAAEVTSPAPFEPRSVGRYLLHRELAAGGMATVCLGRLLGDASFSRVVAIKRPFPRYATDPAFVTMFLDEARLAARVRHPNVVSTLEVVTQDDEIFLVMDYVAGETLANLLSAARARSEPIEPALASAIMEGLLEGLHAAHTATDAEGRPLGIVHRDVSPQNVLVGTDGVVRVVDFGVAKGLGRAQSTGAGEIKGKVVYMPPEQMGGGTVDARTDVWAAGAVLWELLAGRRLFGEADEAMRFHAGAEIAPPDAVSGRATALDAVAMRALARDPGDRFPSARAMLMAIERAAQPAPARRVAQWVDRLAGEALARRARLVREVECWQPPAGPTEAGAVLDARSERRSPTGRRVALAALLVFAGTGIVLGARAVSTASGTTASAGTGAPSSVEVVAPREPSPAPSAASATSPAASASPIAPAAPEPPSRAVPSKPARAAPQPRRAPARSEPSAPELDQRK